MPSDERLSALQAFDIADSMQAAAAAALNLRRATRASLSAEAYEALVEKETSLRYDADRYRAVGITLLAGAGKITTQQLLSGAAACATVLITDVSNGASGSMQ